MGFFVDSGDDGCGVGCGILSFIFFVIPGGLWIAKECGMPHDYIPDMILTKSEQLDDAIKVNDYEKAHDLIADWTIVGNGTQGKAIEKTLRAEYVYLINHNEFLRAENLASQYEDGHEILVEVLNQQKSNIYKKFNDFDDRTLGAICSYMNQYDFMSQYINNVNDPNRIISFLQMIPVNGAGQIGSSTDSDVRKANEEYAANVSKYNQVCDLVLSHAINTRNIDLAAKVIQSYKKSIKTSLTETHTFSANEYSFEYDDSARLHAIARVKASF